MAIRSKSEATTKIGDHAESATRHPVATVAATILGSSLAFVDGSVVNVALPTIGRSFDAGPAALAWMINAYLLPLGALILLGGALGDHYGRRRVFQTGVAIFVAASVVCAIAPTLALIFGGRGMQGIGSALLMPSSLAILGANFSGTARGRAIGTWAAVGAMAGALGPLLGGWIVDVYGWRPIFLINVPIGLAAMWLARSVEESRDRRENSRLDGLGAIVATGGLGMIVWALSAAAEPSTSRVALWTAGLIGIGMLLVFVAIERRKGDSALTPPGLFGTSSFIGLSLLTLFLYAALGGLIVALPFLLIRLAHYSAIGAGAAMLPIPLLIGVGSRAMGGIAATTGSKPLLCGGALVVAIGFALYLRVGAEDISYWRDIFPATLVIAAGMAACVAPLTTAVMASVDADHVGAASGFNSALARIGGLLATAALGFVFAAGGEPSILIGRIHYAAGFGALCCIAAAVSGWALMTAKGSRRHR